MDPQQSHKRPLEEEGADNGIKQEEGASAPIKHERTDADDHALPSRDIKNEPTDNIKSETNNDQAQPQRKKAKQSTRCPYLDTVNRHMLDFDFEKLCSVSLSNLNVYACLVCGKYFQGIFANFKFWASYSFI